VEDYRLVNRRNWDERAPAHAASPDYAVQRFADPAFLSDVVRFDLPRLGDVTGMRGVHLQCHIGTDTVSLARLGAQMTGLDFSEPALAEARRVAEIAGADVDFVHSDLYDAVDALGGERFDLVFTGIGALCWLPSIERWADQVVGLLRPGGRLFMREGHPVLWALDDPRPDGLVVLEFPYVETAGTRFVEPTTYVDHEGEVASPETIQFNHGLGQVVTALLRRGMAITALEEHDSVPWPALGDQMRDVGGGEYQLADRPERLPHSYTLQAVRP
jgi:SAM-dependent methyltransferase